MTSFQLARREAIAYTLWQDSLGKTGFPRNPDGSMMDVWQLYAYWDNLPLDIRKPFYAHAGRQH